MHYGQKRRFTSLIGKVFRQIIFPLSSERFWVTWNFLSDKKDILNWKPLQIFKLQRKKTICHLRRDVNKMNGMALICLNTYSYTL